MSVKLRARDSVFWPLALLVAIFCTAMIGAGEYAVQLLLQHTLRLDNKAQHTLEHYALAASQKTLQGPQVLQKWLDKLAEEGIWATVVNNRLEVLSEQRLEESTLGRLRFARHYKTRLSPRGGDAPLVRVPMPAHTGDLILELPQALQPWRRHLIAKTLVLYVVPILLSLLFCVLLYRLLVSPLKHLAAHTLAIDASNLAALPAPELLKRNDELGVLGAALKYFAEHLDSAFAQQRQLLRDLSHELRTPLSRLQVAAESTQDVESLRLRVIREGLQMRELVDRTLQLAWLDSEAIRLTLEPVDVAALWEMLKEDALFESGWEAERLQSKIPENCVVLGELNALAQALENILRNAIRYSPEGGVIHFRAEKVQSTWLLTISDQGPGIPEEKLDCVFEPFTRVDAARSSSGFGLGLAIAKRAVVLQGGSIKASNLHPGLQLTISLQSV